MVVWLVSGWYGPSRCAKIVNALTGAPCLRRLPLRVPQLATVHGTAAVDPASDAQAVVSCWLSFLAAYDPRSAVVRSASRAVSR